MLLYYKIIVISSNFKVMVAGVNVVKIEYIRII